MNRFDFYKELYYKEEEKKNEINNSFSLPIGVISGLVAANFYFLTTFDFKLNVFTTIVFSLITLIGIIFLGISVFHLIKAYANFHNGYEYLYLADALDLEKYFEDLKKYYQANPTVADISEQEFEKNIYDEIVKNTDSNQKKNKTKSFHRYICQKHLITAFLFFCLNLLPFGFNYALKQNKKENIAVDIKSPVDIRVNSKNNRIFVDSILLNHESMGNEKIVVKPTPPPSQVIKEGQDPNIKRPTPQPKPSK